MSIREKELESEISFGKFNLYRDAFYFPETIISHDKDIIASDQDGLIHYYSEERKQGCTFKGAGG